MAAAIAATVSGSAAGRRRHRRSQRCWRARCPRRRLRPSGRPGASARGGRTAGRLSSIVGASCTATPAGVQRWTRPSRAPGCAMGRPRRAAVRRAEPCPRRAARVEPARVEAARVGGARRGRAAVRKMAGASPGVPGPARAGRATARCGDRCGRRGGSRAGGGGDQDSGGLGSGSSGVTRSPIPPSSRTASSAR